MNPNYRRWWKKEMILSLSLFLLLVLTLVFIKLNIANAPFLPLVIVFFSSFVVLFTIAIFLGRKGI